MPPLVIAHRGASGYLPEHTLPAKAMAVGLGADYLEQDVALTKDDELLVIHDIYLDRVSDVAQRFPGRAREDGRHYVIDFTLEEIRSLAVTDCFETTEGVQHPMWPARFPLWQSRFHFHTLGEELEFVRGLNYSMGRNVGVTVELKVPWWHHQQGKDVESATLAELVRQGFDTREQPVVVMAFDGAALRRIRTELGPRMGVDVPLVQLIAWNDWHETQERDQHGAWREYDYDWMRDPAQVGRIAEYADIIGPDYPMLVDDHGDGSAEPNGITAAAQAAGLLVYPYTVRRDQLPAWATTADEVYDMLLRRAGVDAVITDFPDLARRWLERHGAELR